MENQEQQIQQQKGQKGKKSTLLLVLLILLVTVTVGYAALSATLTINGISRIDPAEWEVEPDPDTPPACEPGKKCTIDPTDPTIPVVPCTGDNDAECTGPIVWCDGNVCYFKHILKKPGDSDTFTFTFKNSGTIDAKVAAITMPSFNTTQEKFLSYDVKYDDGSSAAVGDTLAAGDSAVFKVTVSFKNVDALPTAAELAQINNGTIAEAGSFQGAVSVFSVQYEQK